MVNAPHRTASEEENFSSSALSFKQALHDLMQQEMLRRTTQLALTAPRIVTQSNNDALRPHFSNATFVDNQADLFFLLPDFAHEPQPLTQAIFCAIADQLADLGVLLFATLAPDMRFVLGDTNAPAYLRDWPTLVDLGDALIRSGFQQPALDRDTVTFSYTSLDALRTELAQEHWWISEDDLSAWLKQFSEDHEEYLVPINIVYGMALKKPDTVSAEQTIHWPH